MRKKLTWEEEVVQAVIGANEHMSHSIDIILEQMQKIKDAEESK